MEENHYFAEDARSSGILEVNFQEEWKHDKEFGEWLEESDKRGFFYCKFCEKAFPLGPSGYSQIAKHSVSIKHKQKKEIFHQGNDDSDVEIDVSDADGRRSKRIAIRKTIEADDLKEYIAYEEEELEDHDGDEDDEHYEDLEIEGKNIIEHRKKVLQEAEESQEEDYSGESEEEPIPVYVMEGNPRFLQEWKTDPELSPWLVEKANNTAYCSYCKCFLRISAGKKALTKHMKTEKHNKNRPYIIQEFHLGDNVSEVVVPKDENDKGYVKKRRYAKYSPRWGLDPDLKDWITEKRGLAFCKICSQYLRVISGRKNLIRHKNSQKHITNEESLVKQQCRICLKNHDLKFMPSIWDRDKFTDMKIYRKIMHCTGIVIKREDTEKVTDKICLGCADQLNTSFNFLKTCEFSEKFFDSIAKGVPVEIPKEEFKLDTNEVYSEDESYGEDEYIDDGSDPTYAHIKKEKNVILDEAIQAVVYEETAGINMEEGAYEAEIITDGGLGDFKDDQNIQILSGDIIGDEMKFEIKEPQFKRFRPNETTTTRQLQHQQQRVKSYAEEAKVVRNVAPEQQIYICDVCGNTYDKKSKLQTHIKNHSDEKPHECEICGKTFKHASKLSMHMFTHTGEKPFKCNYCERKFGDHTSRKRHERLHRNERPFACQVCGKTFTYASALKAHKVVHTGEKNFHCIPCGKSFPQKHNLTSHLNTITHRNIVKTLEADSTTTIIEEDDEDKEIVNDGNVEYTIEAGDIMNVNVDGSTIILSDNRIPMGYQFHAS